MHRRNSSVSPKSNLFTDVFERVFICLRKDFTLVWSLKKAIMMLGVGFRIDA